MDAEVMKTQKGCGYCYFEKKCPIRSRTENKAKAGCSAFVHYTQDAEPFKSEFEKLNITASKGIKSGETIRK